MDIISYWQVEYANGIDWISHPDCCRSIVTAEAIAMQKAQEGNQVRIAYYQETNEGRTLI